jgi:hypothetical protein
MSLEMMTMMMAAAAGDDETTSSQTPVARPSTATAAFKEIVRKTRMVMVQEKRSDQSADTVSGACACVHVRVRGYIYVEVPRMLVIACVCVCVWLGEQECA